MPERRHSPPSPPGQGRRGRAAAAGKRSQTGKAIALSCHLYGGSFAHNARIVMRRLNVNVIDRIAQAVQHEADRIMDAYWRAIDKGDWRAAEALIDRHYGRAIQRLDTAHASETTSAKLALLAAMTPEERAELKARLIAEQLALVNRASLEPPAGEHVSQSPSDG